MTTEDDFQRALDAHPGDWQTRLVFADWLQERGDPRADGYRVLGRLRLYPFKLSQRWRYNHNMDDTWLSHITQPRSEGYIQSDHVLPASWVAAASPNGQRCDIVRKSRRATDNDAARAFAKLPAERRAELLALEAAPKPPARKAKPKPKKAAPKKPRKPPARKGKAKK